MSNIDSESKISHWQKTRNLSLAILICWAFFALVVPWTAASLNAFGFLGFPLGYYMCVQGSLIAFVALIWFQNWRQDAIDDEFGLGN